MSGYEEMFKCKMGAEERARKRNFRQQKELKPRNGQIERKK